MTPVEAGFLIMAVVLTAALTVWVLHPLRRGDLGRTRGHGVPRDVLMQRRAAVLDLRDLDADRALGRIDDADYELRRAGILEEGALAQEQVDEWRAAASETFAALSARLEADIAASRSARGRCHCNACGQLVDTSDRFCSHCGSPLGGSRESGSLDGTDAEREA